MNIVVKGCEDCYFMKSHTGHGEGWKYCSAPESPEGYGNILDCKMIRGNNGVYYVFNEGKPTPEWCPLPVNIKVELEN